MIQPNYSQVFYKNIEFIAEIQEALVEHGIKTSMVIEATGRK